MIFPLSHESQEGRRWPLITIGIIVLNILVFMVTNSALESGVEETSMALGEAIEYYDSHPWLKPPPVLQPHLKARAESSRKQRLQSEAVQALHESAADAHGGVDDATKADQQAELDAICARIEKVEQSSPAARFAYTPAKNNLLGLITSQFLHFGWLHLIGNMWFLWLAGCNMEDRWGRLWFPVFYLSAGVVACLVHKLSAPTSMVPTLGASGAIAGTMGAFLMRYAKTKIQFLVTFGLRGKVFWAPAYVMLPLWLAENVLAGMSLDTSGGGVAYWAHVGGFVFGVAFAIGFQKSGMEAKVDQAIEGQISLNAAPEIVEAGELISHGQAEQAIEILEKFAATDQTNIDAQLELLRAAKMAQDQTREKRAYVRLIGLYMQHNEPDTALRIYEEMQDLGLDHAVPAPLRLRLGKHMEKQEQLDKAASEYCNIYSNEKPDATSFQALLAHANLALKMKQKDEAIRLYTIAQNSPIPHLDWESAITHGLKQAQTLSGQATASSAS